MNYIRWTLPFKRNGVICLPIFIAWRTWGLKIIEGWYWNLTRKRKTEKNCNFAVKVQVEDQSESCESLRPPLPTQSHAIRLSTRPTLPSVPPENESLVFLRIRAYLPWRPSGKSPMKRAYPTNMSLSETCHSHGRKFPCVLIHYRLINGKCLFLFPPSERWTVIV